MNEETRFCLNEMYENHYCLTKFHKEYGLGYEFTKKELDKDLIDQDGEGYLPLWLQFKMFIWWVFRGGKKYYTHMIDFHNGWVAHGKVMEEMKEMWNK